MYLIVEIIVYNIFPYMKIKDIINFQTTCKQYSKLNIWHEIGRRDYKCNIKEKENTKDYII